MPKPILNQAVKSKPPAMAPPVYRPQPVPRVLQRKVIAGQQPNRSAMPPRAIAPPRVLRPQASNSIQPKTVLQQRKPPVAPPAYRPQPKTINLKQSQTRPLAQTKKAASMTRPKPKSSSAIQQRPDRLTQRHAAAPATRPVVQRYTAVSDPPFQGKLSQNGRYLTGGLPEIYVQAGSTVERSYNTGRTRTILGVTYEVWQPSIVLIGDCVAAMEEIMHGKKLKYGAPDMSEYRDLVTKGGKKPSKKRRMFGESDDDNRKRGKVSDKGEKAKPGLLEGYVIARQLTDRHLSLPQFHGAAVVAQDGDDNITLEATAPPSGSIDPLRVAGVYDMYGQLKDQSFKEEYAPTYGVDASVSVVKAVKYKGGLPKKVLDDPLSVKVVDYTP